MLFFFCVSWAIDSSYIVRIVPIILMKCTLKKPRWQTEPNSRRERPVASHVQSEHPMRLLELCITDDIRKKRLNISMILWKTMML